MDNLIDYTYFKNKLLIPNAVETGYVQQAVTALITEEQYNLLQMMLGPVLYEQFVTWYETNPLDELNPFFYLLNGKVFTSDIGYQVNWIGLVNSSKLSPIAGYVYCKWQEENVTQSVSAGEVKTNSQNSISAPGTPKYVSAWNMMGDMINNYYQFMQQYFSANIAWNDYVGADYYGWYYPTYNAFDWNVRSLNTQYFLGQPVIRKKNTLDL